MKREAEQGPAVAAAKQEDEPLQVGVQVLEAVGGVADAPGLGQISAYLFGHATAAGFMIRPCACRCRDATDQVADWRDL
jgi:hypothetical protein